MTPRSAALPGSFADFGFAGSAGNDGVYVNGKGGRASESFGLPQYQQRLKQEAKEREIDSLLKATRAEVERSTGEARAALGEVKREERELDVGMSVDGEEGGKIKGE